MLKEMLMLDVKRCIYLSILLLSVVCGNILKFETENQLLDVEKWKEDDDVASEETESTPVTTMHTEELKATTYRHLPHRTLLEGKNENKNKIEDTPGTNAFSNTFTKQAAPKIYKDSIPVDYVTSEEVNSHTTREINLPKKNLREVKVNYLSSNANHDHFSSLSNSNNQRYEFYKGGSKRNRPEMSEIARKESSDDKVIDCYPCFCWRHSYGNLTADCSGRKLWSVPTNLPADVTLINMSFNGMRDFNTSSVLIYTRLTGIDLRQNKIRKVFGNVKQPLEYFSNHKLNYINLYYNRLNYIEDGAFCAFSYLNNLQLSYNLLVNITNGTFKCLQNLSILDISKNRIMNIADKSFEDLINLKALYLNNNAMLTYSCKRLKASSFETLKKLKIFHIHGCYGGSQIYPNHVFKMMPLLQELSIDGLDSPLFYEPMIHLQTITIGRHATCIFKILPAKLFQNSPNLKHFTVEFCRFTKTDPRVFNNTPKLESLTMSHVSSYDLDKAFEGLQLLENTTLKSLKMIHLYHKARCRILSHEQGKYLKNLHSLEELDLSDNCLSLLDNQFLRSIPRSLLRLDLSENRFDLNGNLWNRMLFLKKLHELDVSNQNTDWRTKYHAKKMHIPGACQTQYYIDNEEIDLFVSSSTSLSKLDEVKESASSERTLVNHRRLNSTVWEGGHLDTLTSHITPKKDDDDNNNDDDNNIEHDLEWKGNGLPPNLRIVKASMYIGFGELLLHMPRIGPNELAYLYFPDTFMATWGTGHLPENVKCADFSYNPCSELSHDFFPENNALLCLDISHNYLGYHFYQDREGKIFSHLSKLRHLYIASNTIFSLPGDFFKGLSNLLTLDLSENKLRVLNFTLTHMKSIRSIDVSKNSIYYVSQETRDDMDRIATHQHLEVDFADNPIPCTCDGLDLLKWMATTNVALRSRYFLTCVNSNGKVERMRDISERYEILRRQCMSKLNLIEIAFLSLVFLLFIFPAVIYRYRWRLRYMKNRIFSKWMGFKPRQPTNQSFKFDAYILYDEDDEDLILGDAIQELEKNRGHKICVEDRDFIPGTFTSNNITCAIQNSNVTLLIISPSSINSPELDYVLQMALMEEIYSEIKREVLFLILYQVAEERISSADLLSLLKNHRYLDFPPLDDDDVTAEVVKGFWDKLSEVIGHTNDTDVSPCLNVGD